MRDYSETERRCDLSTTILESVVSEIQREMLENRLAMNCWNNIVVLRADTEPTLAVSECWQWVLELKFRYTLTLLFGVVESVQVDSALPNYWEFLRILNCIFFVLKCEVFFTPFVQCNFRNFRSVWPFGTTFTLLKWKEQQWMRHHCAALIDWLIDCHLGNCVRSMPVGYSAWLK